MKQVLILTKNVYMEAKLQERFQLIGYESFSSSIVLKLAMKNFGTEFFLLFKTIIISDTIPDKEVEQVLNGIRDIKSLCIYRICEEEPTQETKIRWREKGINDWINKNISVRGFTEIMYTANQEENFNPPENLSSMDNLKDVLTTLIANLSSKERKLFFILYQAHGRYISREKLSQLLWEKKPSNSTMSQLSQIVNRIKKKSQELKINQELILTHWKRGYCLTNELFTLDTITIMGEPLMEVAEQ